MNGARFTHIWYDESVSELPRRALIVQRTDGTTYSADIPEDFDLGDVLDEHETVVADTR